MDRKEASVKWSEIAERLYLGDDYTLTKDDFSLVNEALNLFKYPVRKNGYWLEGIDEFDPKTKEFSCSECGHQIALRFCPNCGADMRKNEEELRQALAKELGCDSDEITRIIT